MYLHCCFSSVLLMICGFGCILQEQLHESEQTIHELERKLEEKERELLTVRLDNEAVSFGEPDFCFYVAQDCDFLFVNVV